MDVPVDGSDGVFASTEALYRYIAERCAEPSDLIVDSKVGSAATAIRTPTPEPC